METSSAGSRGSGPIIDITMYVCMYVWLVGGGGVNGRPLGERERALILCTLCSLWEPELRTLSEGSFSRTIRNSGFGSYAVGVGLSLSVVALSRRRIRVPTRSAGTGSPLLIGCWLLHWETAKRATSNEPTQSVSPATRLRRSIFTCCPPCMFYPVAVTWGEGGDGDGAEAY